MATQYLTRAGLEALVGVKILQTAEQQLQANVDAVIVAACAIADGYVRKQVALPPTAQAIEQVAPVVAELVLTSLYLSSSNPEMSKRREAAMKALRDIGAGLTTLHFEPGADDPSTPEDESSGSGAAFGAAPRRSGWYA